MARITLILAPGAGDPAPTARVADWRAALEAAGHEVECLVAGTDRGADGDWRRVRAEVRGPAAAAIEGIRQARGDVLLVLDPGMNYDPADLARLAEPLAAGRADLVLASRLAPRPGAGRGPVRAVTAGLGALARRLTGSSDPLAGLVGLTRAARDAALDGFAPVGTKFSLELLAKVRGRVVDLPVRKGLSTWRTLPGWDDVRHLKRLADHRFGNVSRLIQFCIVGASGMVVDLTCYATLQWAFARLGWADRPAPLVGGPLNLAAAGVLSVTIALVWNFSLNRRLTFNYARAGSAVRQFCTYALSNAVSVPVSLALRLSLPLHVAFFARHRLAAAVVGIVAATGISFSMSRWLVFRRAGAAGPAGPEPAPESDPTPRRIPNRDEAFDRPARRPARAVGRTR